MEMRNNIVKKIGGLYELLDYQEKSGLSEKIYYVVIKKIIIMNIQGYVTNISILKSALEHGVEGLSIDLFICIMELDFNKLINN